MNKRKRKRIENVMGEKQFKTSYRNAQKYGNIIRISKYQLAVVDYAAEYLYQNFAAPLCSVFTSFQSKRKSKRYFILYGDDFLNMPKEYKMIPICHELGHIKNGDLTPDKNKLQMTYRFRYQPFKSNIATLAEISADEYAIRLMDSPSTVYECLKWIYDHQLQYSERSELDKIGLKELEIRMEHIQNKYIK